MVKGPNDRLRGIKYKDERVLTDLDDKSLHGYAFGFFETFKGLIPGLLLSSQDRQVSRDFFLNRTAKDSFKIIEVELNLIYEVLHTKVVVVRCWAGYVFRIICSTSVPMAFLVFGLVDKRGFHNFDVHLTYVLFIGALILDAISFIKLMFLDRTVIALEIRWARFIDPTICFLKEIFPDTWFLKRKWSESFYWCNFMSYCLRDFSKCTNILAKLFWAGSLLDKLRIMRSLSPEHFNKELKDFIFKELRGKSLIADNASKIGKICSSRGDWALRHFFDKKLKRSVQDGLNGSVLDELKRSVVELKWSVEEFEYAESLLLWHIATELRYNASSTTSNDDINKELSKLLSDYAFYLVLMQPTIMAPVSGNWQIVFQDTCAEAKRFFRNKHYLKHSEACVEILAIEADIKPGAVKGDVSKSVLFDACILAKELSKLGEQNQWELMSKMWLEMLCYAAIHCRASVHTQQPSKGGELLTLIWLLMNHLGLGNQFYESNAARIKFIVKK